MYLFNRININFIFFLFVLAVSFIFIVYENESIEKEIKNKEESLENIRYEYITTKAHLMSFTRYSVIKTKLEILGFKDYLEQPIIIQTSNE